jgi:predicted Zn-dependent protease
MAADWQRDLSEVPLHLTRLSDEEEIRVGDALAEKCTSSRPPSNPQQRATEQYINQVGGRVAAHARRSLPYRFHLILNPDLINAFALPGGHVCVGQGLVDRMMSEDELAFVLGHEIEHIDHYHAVERVQIEAQLKNLDLDVLVDLAEFPISLWQTGYSKAEEFEADREGLRIAAATGYSAQGALDQLGSLDEAPQRICGSRGDSDGRTQSARCRRTHRLFPYPPGSVRAHRTGSGCDRPGSPSGR